MLSSSVVNKEIESRCRCATRPDARRMRFAMINSIANGHTWGKPGESPALSRNGNAKVFQPTRSPITRLT